MEKNTNGNRPKLELVVNQPLKVKLLKDKPFEGNSPYGDFRLYSLEVEGVEHAYFAPVEVHQLITEQGFKAGDEFILSKTAVQNGRKIVPKITVEKVAAAVGPLAETKAQVQTDDLKSIMERSLRDALDITRAVRDLPFQTSDIQKIASCLFIART